LRLFFINAFNGQSLKTPVLAWFEMKEKKVQREMPLWAGTKTEIPFPEQIPSFAFCESNTLLNR
jgi:hypothetical protein